MGKVITFANKKGGSGKTSTVVNLGGVLGERGKKVLMIDLDPQAHTSYWSGVNTYDTSYPNIYQILQGKIKPEAALFKPEHGLYDVLPAVTDFSREVLKSILDSRESQGRLNKALLRIKRSYDFVLIDTPPTVALLTLNALVASDYVLIPILLNFLAIEGLAQLAQNIYKVNYSFNQKLRIMGIVPNQYDIRSNHSKSVVNEIFENFGEDNITPRIRNDIKIAEAPEHRLPINLYAPKSKGNMDFQILANFVLEKLGER